VTITTSTCSEEDKTVPIHTHTTSCINNISVDYDTLNDLWRFDGRQWTWLTGSQRVNATGTWGTLGQPDPANTPSARMGYAVDFDPLGRVLLWGGIGVPGSGSPPCNSPLSHSLNDDCVDDLMT
jgi:hypothetical protein